jgi:hypothetical protein
MNPATIDRQTIIERIVVVTPFLGLNRDAKKMPAAMINIITVVEFIFLLLK